MSVVNVQYLQTHPLRNTIKTRSSSQVTLNTPPVGDQGNLNSCVGWALCYAGASIRLYDNIPDWSVAKCSPSYLFNQHKGSIALVDTTNCDSVSSSILYLGYCLTHEGTCSLAQMPYTTNCNLRPTIADSIDALNKRFTVNAIPQANLNDTSFYKLALRQGWPIVVGMPLYDSFETMWYNPTAHGMWNSVDTTAHSLGLGHASCIVGYDDTKDAFKVMNSWGTSGGDAGFYWAKYSVVQQGAFRDAVMVILRDSAQIEGQYTMTDTTAWYHIRNVPVGATITWSIQNISPQTFQFETASPQNRDSMRIAWRPIPPDPGLPINGNSEIDGPKPRYQQADITVTVSGGGQSYSTTKRIRKEVYSLPFMLRDENSDDNVRKVMLHGDYIQVTNINGASSVEVWHAMYGCVLTQGVRSNTELIDVRNLPQGVYIIILKNGESIVAETKLFIQ